MSSTVRTTARDFEEIRDRIVSIVGDDWNAPRARVFIAAEIQNGQLLLKEVERIKEMLVIENRVSARVEEALARRVVDGK